MSKQILHGIELTETFFPPWDERTIAQWSANVRGRHFLFIHRVSPGGQYRDWEAYEYHQVTLSCTITEYSRELSSMVQLVIDTVERESMDRLKPGGARSKPSAAPDFFDAVTDQITEQREG